MSPSRSRRNVGEIRSPTGTELTAKSWATEAPLRMLMNNLDPDVADSAHIASREMISTVEHPTLGSIPLVHQPVRFSGAERAFQRPPPGLGEHTRELLASLLGLGDAEIQALADDNVI